MDIVKLKNYYEHPTQRQYWVFHFYNMDMANAFEQGLIDATIEFEKDLEEGMAPKAMFGIHRRYYQQCMQLNNKVIGKHRKPFIANPVFKWFVLIMVFGSIALAIMGYLKDA